jgi:hypothetical protein
MGIDAIEQATFLSDKQKRDILFDNAVRFFKIGQSTPRKTSRVSGG